MAGNLPNLSTEQWDFLSVLHAFGGPVPIDIAGAVAPVPPGPFLDLTGRGNKTKFIFEAENEHYSIVHSLPPGIMKRLDEINSQDRLNEIVDKLYDDKLIDKVSPSMIERLFAKLEKPYKTVEIEINLARKALERREITAAINILESLVKRLYPIAKEPGLSHHFVAAVIELAEIRFTSTKDLDKPIAQLKKALEVSEITGDRRSHAVLNLILSFYLELIGKYEEMWEVFSSGYKEVNELGDHDILYRTAGVLGSNFFHQGLYEEARRHFERILPFSILTSADSSKSFYKNRAIYEYGISLIFSGKFYEAMGYFFLNWRTAKDKSAKATALFAKNMFCVVLLMIKEVDMAKELLKSALKEAKQIDDIIILYVLQINFAYMYFLKGQFGKAAEMISKTSALGKKAGTFRFPLASYILEMLFELEQLGYPPDPRFNYKDQVQIILGGINSHFKGTVLRLEAVAMSRKNESPSRIGRYLSSSEKYLKQSGDPFQLGKTFLEMARLNIKKGRNKQAKLYVRKACESFGDYAHLFLTEDLKHFLEPGEAPGDPEFNRNELYLKWMKTYDSIMTSESVEDIQFKALRSICDFVKAERAALFRFDTHKNYEKPAGVTLYNITQSEIESVEFKTGNSFVLKALKTKKTCLWRTEAKPVWKDGFPIRSLICIPIVDEEDRVPLVLYLDNIFLNDGYDKADPILINELIKRVALRVEQMSENGQFEEEKNLLIEEKSIQQKTEDEMQFQNPMMAEIISKVDKIAATDSAALICGETGTGKELLAQRIHNLSLRNKNPFIVVDLTSIPENLLESELFGHEKGSFTGADRRKIGRLEMAHNGSLFLDEIGDFPLYFQVKLLRVLQEKKFMRVGGSQELSVDFRLIAATNRNLEDEVVNGRFRRDLYYRLNVMPITLPPLRERQNDIILLARYFLNKYAKKYNRPNIRLSVEDEAWLMTYPWPGNIREMKNILERAVILSTNSMLNLNKMKTFPALSEQIIQTGGYPPVGIEDRLISVGDLPTLEEVQRRYVRMVLEITNGKISGRGGATNILGMKPSSLYTRMKKLGIR